MMTSCFQTKLPQVRKCFASHPVDRAWLFGSFARGEERPDSDVDFIVQYTPEQRVSLLDAAALWRSLHDLLDRDIDVVEDGCLLPYAVESANRDKILIYERTPQRQGTA